MPRVERFKNCLICESLIQDTYNRYTLVGVFTNDVIVSELPARIRLALYGEFSPTSTGEHRIELAFALDDKEFARVVAVVNVVNTSELIVVAFPGFDVGIDKELELIATVRFNDETKSRELIRKKIKKGAIPGAVPIVSRPLSELSQPAASPSASKPAPSRPDSRVRRRRS